MSKAKLIDEVEPLVLHFQFLLKKLNFGISLPLVMLVLFTASSVVAQTTPDNAGKPAVVKAVAPKAYPAIAISARAGGKVIIKVTINPKGEVVSAKLASGHALLQATSLEASYKWLFSAAEKGEGERSAELEFFYTQVDKPEAASVSFMPPYRVEIAAAPGRIY